MSITFHFKFCPYLSSFKVDQTFSEDTSQHRGKDLLLNQIRALFLKKRIYTWRNKIFLLALNSIPMFFVYLALLNVAEVSIFFKTPLPAMLINLIQYPEAVTILETNSLTPNSLESSIAEQYKTIATSFGTEYTFESTGNNTFTEYILNLGKTIQNQIDVHYLAAATVAPGEITAWLNNQPLHTAPLTVNLVHNAMAR